jgi:ADP-heptose:LPS heptosyltransferase
MESKNRIKLAIKDFLIAFEYLLWLIFDFCKFKIVRKDKIKKVLFVHSGAIGELLVSTPAVRAIKEQLKAEIHYMVSPGKENILAGNPNISKIVNLGNFKQNLALMKKEKYDLAVILWPGSLRVGMAAFMAGV